MFTHEFVRNAFLAGTATALAAGLIGYFLVVRNQVFTGDALSHLAFTGALASFALGFDPLLGLFTATTVGAVGIGSLGSRGRERDVVIGTVFAWVLGLGVLFLSVYTTSRSSANGSAGVSVLFGSIFGLSVRSSLVAVAIGLSAAVAMLVLARPLLFASLQPEVAAGRGMRVRWLGLSFMVLVGVIVAEAVQAVGALLVIGLLVTPAATAQRLTSRPFVALVLGAALGVLDVWVGLSVSYEFSRVPPSFSIVGLAFITYVGVMVATSVGKRGRRGRGMSAGGGHRWDPDTRVGE